MTYLDYIKMIDATQTSQINLAFIGDAVYDLYIRTRLLAENPRMKTAKLSKLKSEYVNAKSQSFAVMTMMESLSTEEKEAFKRGRNAKSKSAPKGKSIAEYRNATGFESLLAYLYLQSQFERLEEVMAMSYEIVENMLLEKCDEEK